MRFEKKKNMAINVSGEHAVSVWPPRAPQNMDRFARPIGSGKKSLTCEAVKEEARRIVH
jgi:hypothetical protein